MSTLQEDIDRGYLETGEPIEAAWGMGWWSDDPCCAAPTTPEVCECFKCGGDAYDLGDWIDCEKCGLIPVPERMQNE